MVEEVHILHTDTIEVIGLMDGHGFNSMPLVVFPIGGWGRDFAKVDFGIEVGSKLIAVIATVTV